MELVVETYRVTGKLPKQETYGLASQMQRAAVSIPSNVAEGHTREHIKEYLSVAQGSLAELETQVEIAKRLNYLSSEQCQDVAARMPSLGKQLYALRNSLRKSDGDKLI